MKDYKTHTTIVRSGKDRIKIAVITDMDNNLLAVIKDMNNNNSKLELKEFRELIKHQGIKHNDFKNVKSYQGDLVNYESKLIENTLNELKKLGLI